MHDVEPLTKDEIKSLKATVKLFDVFNKSLSTEDRLLIRLLQTIEEKERKLDETLIAFKESRNGLWHDKDHPVVQQAERIS